MIYLTTFAASFLYVSLKAFQQLSVMHDKYLWITPVSIGMGLTEVLIVGTVSVMAVNVGGFWPLFWLGLSLGVGGAGGAVLSMKLHKKIRKEKKSC